jgi:urea carboxylase
MGLVTCNTTEEVRQGFGMVKSRSEILFKNSGVFIERYYPSSHHIEVQIFGNGQGQAIHFGERECSIQRRHQKVIEEAPSPFVAARPGLRERLGAAAVILAESIKYGSAGTVEYLVDDRTGEFFFLEMNTRLQVEHGITELCYDVDLVELMLKQADAQLMGKGGLPAESLKAMQPSKPRGVAIEARVYAENPVRNYAPSPGLLQKVEWEHLENARVDTWVFTGSTITPNYDPLIAKLMIHARTRVAAIKGMDLLLTRSQICGPPTNLEFLVTIMQDDTFKSGSTLTSFLDDFEFTPAAIDVISPGAYTLIQDLPGRPAVGKGIPHSGAMDPVALSIANMLVGNDRGKEGLEITLSGPELHFLSPAIVSLTGATMEATLNGDTFPMWTRKHIKAGQKLKIGKATGGGCRAYLAVHGGFPGVAEYFGSKSTSPIVGISGYQGRALAPGDLLKISDKNHGDATGYPDIPEHLRPADHGRLSSHPSIPEHLRPTYPSHWVVLVMPGPHDEGYLTPEDIEMLYSTQWKVSHNASRSAIRLIGPVPKWARKDGGEGGAHPSNLIEYGYPLGGLNFTGDDPCIFPVDCPNFGGFISANAIIRADWWKMGQMKAGDTVTYKRVSLAEALAYRTRGNDVLDALEKAIDSADFANVQPLAVAVSPTGSYGSSIVEQIDAAGTQPSVRYRQGGDDHLLVEYGNEEFDINHRCRTTALEKALRGKEAPDWLKDGLVNTVSGCTSLMLFYDGLKVPRDKLVKHLQALEEKIGDLSKIKVPCRRFKLPLSFESKVQDEATERYMESTRPHAPYLPSNLDFVAKNNASTPDQLKSNFLNGTFMAVIMGFFSGNTVSLPVDPRHRMSSPKANPSRTFTPEGTAGWGGSCLSIYPSDSPGGYMMLGQTIPCFDQFGFKKGFTPERPWLFQDFDLIEFECVSEEEINKQLLLFRSGRYEWQWENTEFDMAEHNKLLQETADEVREIRAKQAKAQDEQTAAENESLAKWREDKSRNKVDEGTLDVLLNGEEP